MQYEVGALAWARLRQPRTFQLLPCFFLFITRPTFSQSVGIPCNPLVILYQGETAGGMSFGFSIGDVIAVSSLARSIWGRYRDASDRFNVFKNE